MLNLFIHFGCCSVACYITVHVKINLYQVSKTNARFFSFIDNANIIRQMLLGLKKINSPVVNISVSITGCVKETL